ncbi:hypothetical protein CC78DRAFT_608374 [Lojkania enalia]|uniref:Uncharacterized protein n=1 Tax=Lojkania enalia TaxID=147567 RepID=A0A9P4K2E6_9PLEO|nr:hypothetical protein CC78DRAFT_608374 [Didymosphaeria enalia]
MNEAPDETAADVRAIIDLLKSHNISDLPGLDLLSWSRCGSGHGSRDARPLKLFLGTRDGRNLNAFCVTSPGRHKTLRYVVQGERLELMREDYASTKFVEPFACIMRMKNAGPEYRCNVLSAYVRACFAMKGLTRGSPLEVTGNFISTLKRAVQEVTTSIKDKYEPESIALATETELPRTNIITLASTSRNSIATEGSNSNGLTDQSMLPVRQTDCLIEGEPQGTSDLQKYGRSAPQMSPVSQAEGSSSDLSQENKRLRATPGLGTTPSKKSNGISDSIPQGQRNIRKLHWPVAHESSESEAEVEDELAFEITQDEVNKTLPREGGPQSSLQRESADTANSEPLRRLEPEHAEEAPLHVRVNEVLQEEETLARTEREVHISRKYVQNYEKEIEAQGSEIGIQEKALVELDMKIHQLQTEAAEKRHKLNILKEAFEGGDTRIRSAKRKVEEGGRAVAASKKKLRIMKDAGGYDLCEAVVAERQKRKRSEDSLFAQE